MWFVLFWIKKLNPSKTHEKNRRTHKIPIIKKNKTTKYPQGEDFEQRNAQGGTLR